MPIYAYKCSSCGFAKDVLQKISDAPLEVCSSCGQPHFKKQVTAAGFQLKGSGWYVTDFRGNGNTGASGQSQPAAESGEASTGTTTAATPATDTPKTSAPSASTSSTD
jgi:putative FmdB family regulatory protein